MRVFLGLDIGTSAVKAAVIDERGGVIDQTSAALAIARPHDLWSEQDPDAWVEATDKAVRSLDPVARSALRGIGLAGQMHGATLLGADDRPLRPAILWNDGRSFAECEQLESMVPGIGQVTGNLAMPGFTAPKLIWVRLHEPRIFEMVRTVLLPKDYVRLAMTGEKASDMSDSSGTLWLDVGGRRWDPDLLEATGLSVGHMPSLHEGTSVTGRLRAAVAERWGVPIVPVAAGGGDNAAAALGMGAVSDGDGMLSLGTSGVTFVVSDAFRPNVQSAVHTFCHCVPGKWHQMAVHLSAASCLNWAARLTGAGGPDALIERAQSVGPAAGPELFLPYLSGERTPHNDPLVRGAFLGLDNDSDADRIAQSVLEGVAFALADGVRALRDAGTTVERLSVVGGGARSRYWGTVIAAALDVELAYPVGGEVGPALGAARSAQLAVDGGEAAVVCKAPQARLVLDPDRDIVERLAPKLERFRESYSRITPVEKGH